MKHIFVVDDERNIRDLIKMYLVKEEYRVTLFENGQNLISEINRLKPDLIVLDIMMPGTNGFELCKEIIKRYDLPVIFVTAKDEELDKILGLELGGDDYLTKPFSPRELVARIKNVFKRLEKAQITPQLHEIKIKDVILFPIRRHVECNGNEVKFTMREFDLLDFLIKNKNMPFTREQLLEKVWGFEYTGDARLIDDLIKRIRKKLSEADAHLEISTVWGYGYKIDE